MSLIDLYSIQARLFKFTFSTFFLNFIVVVDVQLAYHRVCLSWPWSASSSVTPALYLSCNIRDNLNFDPSLS